MSLVYAVGGRNKPNAMSLEEWSVYEGAQIVAIDLETGRCEVACRYETPPEFLPEDNPSILFKAGTASPEGLWVCTQTEVLRFGTPGFDLLERVTHPWLNDVHHVAPRTDGNLLVANTGLDMVLELDRAGEVLAMWSAHESSPWDRFDRDVDYRRVATTKPHLAHPNFVFEHAGRIWTTRFEQQDTICLEDPRIRIELGQRRPHDGVRHGDELYFTTVDGHVIVVDPSRQQVTRRFDLNTFSSGVRKLGWCRGILVLDRDLVLVGFSRLRPTRWKENVSWVKGGMRALKTLAHQPSRVALYDLAAGRLVKEFNVADTGLSAIFSIHHENDFGR